MKRVLLVVAIFIASFTVDAKVFNTWGEADEYGSLWYEECGYIVVDWGDGTFEAIPSGDCVGKEIKPTRPPRKAD